MKSKTGPARAYCFYLPVTAFFLAGLLWFSPVIPTDNRAHAEAPITPSGLNTQVTLSATPPAGTTQYDITGGTRPGGGANMFHSFGEFGVPHNNIANFLNETSLPTDNILARITGGDISTIFGTIQTTGFGNANLFLVNPAGFLFGPNATVNVGGMMTFTTAEYMRLTDGGRFNATPNTTAADLLTAAPVAAFGFIESHPRAINFEGGQLTVANGTGITLVGGDINLVPDSSGTPSIITAPGRPILLTSVVGPGSVAADTGVPTPGMALGTITLGQGSILSTVGDSALGNGSGGSISIRGGQLVATSSTIATSPTPLSTGVGGEVTIAVTGSAAFTNNSLIKTGPSPDFESFVGSAEAVSITADTSLTMTNTTIDTSSIFSGGDGGPVTLRTNGLLSLTDSLISTQASAPGNGGAVTIAGEDVTLNNSSMFTLVNMGLFDLTIDDPALGLVHPGAVNITAENTVSVSGSFVPDILPTINASASGTLVDAASVTIAGKTVNLSNGAIDVSMQQGQTPSPGNSGAIEIRGNNVNLSEFTLKSQNLGFTGSTGKGGNILLRGADNLRADDIQLTNSEIGVGSVSGGGAGNIEFQAQALTLSDTSVHADTAGIGPGGSIAVYGAQTVTLRSNSVIAASALTSGVGNTGPFGAAGTIVLETEQLTMHGGSALKAADLPLSQGNAGSITVQGTNGLAQSILIDGADTGIFTDGEGTGAGGNITLNANTITLQNGGTLSAKTSGAEATATGGSITVNATDHVTMTNGASITASSTGPGNAGDILINAGQQFDMRDSSVTTEAKQASGGDIDIRAIDRVRLVDSSINTSVFGGDGNGGNITIDPNVVVLQGSQVKAEAFQGVGGDITITTPLFLADSTSTVSALSPFGLNGTVTIQSPTSNLSGSLGPLTSKPSQAQALLTQRCAALASGQASSFVVAGREQLPSDPGGWLTSPLAFAALDESLGTGHAASSVPAIMPIAAQDTGTVSLRRLTPAGFLMANFADSEATGCRS